MTNLENLKLTFEQIGNDVRAIKASIGVLENLPTEVKDSLVQSLVEISERIDRLDTDTIIDDSLEESLIKTYSINKIKDSITKAINDLVDNAPEAMNTLSELANYIAVHGDTMTALQEAMADRVAYTKQENSEERKEVARQNIEAPKTSDVVGIGTNTYQSGNYSGDVNVLPDGNYVTALEDVTGLPSDILAIIGNPVTAIVVGNNTFSTKLIVGDRSISFWDSLSGSWKTIAGSGSIVETPITDVILIDITMITGGTIKFESSSPIDTTKRFDVFCNGVLVSPEAITVEDDVNITISLDLAGYEIKEGFSLVLKYILKI